MSTADPVSDALGSRLPPDTFARDLADVKGLLESVESLDAIGSTGTAGRNARWQSDVSELQMEVSKIEESLGHRQPTPATETPQPTSERNER
jgi:hypothetical protein